MIPEIAPEDLTIEEIDKRLEILRASLLTLDASILGAGELNRRAEQREDEYEIKAAWTIMYMAQVYAHGIMDEVDGLVELRDNLEHSA